MKALLVGAAEKALADSVISCAEIAVDFVSRRGETYDGAGTFSCRYWTSFAISGVPADTSTEHPVSWPSYTADADTLLAIDTPIATVAHDRKAQCDWWDQWPVPSVTA
jgi:hypothetical protein